MFTFLPPTKSDTQRNLGSSPTTQNSCHSSSRFKKKELLSNSFVHSHKFRNFCKHKVCSSGKFLLLNYCAPNHVLKKLYALQRRIDRAFGLFRGTFELEMAKKQRANGCSNGYEIRTGSHRRFFCTAPRVPIQCKSNQTQKNMFGYLVTQPCYCNLQHHH